MKETSKGVLFFTKQNESPPILLSPYHDFCAMFLGGVGSRLLPSPPYLHTGFAYLFIIETILEKGNILTKKVVPLISYLMSICMS